MFLLGIQVLCVEASGRDAQRPGQLDDRLYRYDDRRSAHLRQLAGECPPGACRHISLGVSCWPRA